MSGEGEHAVLGIDLGGTHVQLGVVDARGGVAAQDGLFTQAKDGYARVRARVAEAAAKLIRASPLLVRAVGVGVAGACDAGRGVVLRGVNLGWADAPLGPDLSRDLGLSVTIDNDVNAALIGEASFGAGRGHADLLGVWVGTGIGGAIVRGGRLDAGPLGTAGEIGQVVTEPAGAHGARTLEDLCRRPALERALGAGGASQIAERYRAGEDAARRAIDAAAFRLGVAIGNTATLLSLPTVIMGGGLVEELGEALTKPVQEAARGVAFPEVVRDALRVVPGSLRERAGIVGAAALARLRLGA